MLFYIEDNGLGISVPGKMQTPGGDIARNLASFTNLLTRDGDGTNPAEAATLLAECVDHVRGGNGPALVRLTVPRLCSHSGPDNQRGYRSDDEIAADTARDPLPRLRSHPRAAIISATEWAALEAEVARDVDAALTAARARRIRIRRRSGAGSMPTTRPIPRRRWEDSHAMNARHSAPPTRLLRAVTSFASPRPCAGRCGTSSM